MTRVNFRLTPLHALVGPDDASAVAVAQSMLVGDSSCPVCATNPVHYLHTNVDAMVRPREEELTDADVMPDGDGHGMMALWQRIFRADPIARERLQRQFHAAFPAAWHLSISPEAPYLLRRQHDGFPAVRTGLSGIWHWLLYALLAQLDQLPHRIIVNGPERDLHPDHVHQVVSFLRQASRRSQVTILTRCPLVLNELRPDEVTLTRWDGIGLTCTPIAQTENFEERAKVYALGELWLSYFVTGRELFAGWNDPAARPPQPWTVWDNYAACWVCRSCGAAACYPTHARTCPDRAVGHVVDQAPAE